MCKVISHAEREILRYFHCKPLTCDTFWNWSSDGAEEYAEAELDPNRIYIARVFVVPTRSYGVYSTNAFRRKNGNGSLKSEQPNVRAPFKSASNHRYVLHCKWHHHDAVSNRKRDVSPSSPCLKVRRVKICVVTRNFSLSRPDICIADVAG